MRLDVAAPTQNDHLRAITVTLHPSATFSEVIIGSAVDGLNLSPYVERGRHSSKDASLTLRWHDSAWLSTFQPRIGQIISIDEGPVALFRGVVDSINSFNEEKGERRLQITCRARDAVGPWRNKKVTSLRYPVGTSLAGIITDTLLDEGLDASEYNVPNFGYVVPHSNAQFTDTTPWSILETLGLASGISPFTDAVGRVRFWQRNVQRAADVTLEQRQVKRIHGSRARPRLTEYRLKWLDRNLTRVTQQSQVLATQTITAGFFRRHQDRTVYWSEDRRQRAENTYMAVLQSVNDSLLPVGEEEYNQRDEFSGEIEVTTDRWVPALATASLLTMLALSRVPDGVASFGGGVTIPYGRILQAFAEAGILLTMMSLGTGSYEIWGQPYDYVHAVNTTSSFDDSTQYWQERIVDERNDFIFDEAHAQQVTTRELLFRISESISWNVDIADDARLEVGDILELPDQSRLMIQDYSRDITRGSAAMLNVTGIRV